MLHLCSPTTIIIGKVMIIRQIVRKFTPIPFSTTISQFYVVIEQFFRSRRVCTVTKTHSSAQNKAYQRFKFLPMFISYDFFMVKINNLYLVSRNCEGDEDINIHCVYTKHRKPHQSRSISLKITFQYFILNVRCEPYSIKMI